MTAPVALALVAMPAGAHSENERPVPGHDQGPADARGGQDRRRADRSGAGVPDVDAALDETGTVTGEALSPPMARSEESPVILNAIFNCGII